MESCSRSQQRWVLQPLIDAGVDLDDIGRLVFRLAFETIVREGADALSGARELVAGRPVDVRDAWTETLRRMVMLEF